jgi:hypothetical protein
MSSAAVWQGSDAELLAELRALEMRLHSTWAEMLSVIAEVDSRGTAETAGYRTTVDLVRAIGRVSRREARARVAAAADVLPGRGLGGVPTPPRLPATAAAAGSPFRHPRAALVSSCPEPNSQLGHREGASSDPGGTAGGAAAGQRSHRVRGRRRSTGSRSKGKCGSAWYQ